MVRDAVVIFSVIGGCIEEDNVCLVTDLWPVFHQGENVLVFLKEGDESRWVLSDPIFGKQSPETEQELRRKGGRNIVGPKELRGVPAQTR